MKPLSDLLSSGQILGARENQEDNYQITCFRVNSETDNGLLLLLADGMGGHAGGARASELAIAAFIARFERLEVAFHKRLKESLLAANQAIGESIKEDPRYADMGCTLLAGLVIGNAMYWLSVGDSPLWLLRNNKLIRLNADHSMTPVLQDLVELGRMTEKEAAVDPRNSQLRSAVFGEDIALIDQNSKPFQLEDGDWLLFASDGLESLDEAVIRKTLTDNDGDAEAAVNSLLAQVEALELPDQDNATVIAYRHDLQTSVSQSVDDMEAETQRYAPMSTPDAATPHLDASEHQSEPLTGIRGMLRSLLTRKNRP